MNYRYKDAKCLALYDFSYATKTHPQSLIINAAKNKPNEHFGQVFTKQNDLTGIFTVETCPGLHQISEHTMRNLNTGSSLKSFFGFELGMTLISNSIVKYCEFPSHRITPIFGYDDKVTHPDDVFTI